MYQIKNPNPLRPVLSVSELTDQVKDALESQFDHVYVAGEISNAKIYPSGHWYFSMKDDKATLPCVCFKNSNRGIRFKLEDGLAVIARGKLSVYPPRGAYQMIVTSIEPVGIGEWQLAFEQLKEKLLQEGLLDPERKRAIPMLPGKVGVVTSPVGAAVRDIIQTLRRRNQSVEIVVSPAKVQGEGSVESIVAALRLLESVPDLDVVIIARGGGSIEDLWSFNDENVARAVAACSFPTISGVGHETDLTICDLVADLRAPTPTAAAELVARGYGEILEKWKYLNTVLYSALEDKLLLARHRLEQASPQRSLRRYIDRLEHLLVSIEHYRQSMEKLLDGYLARGSHRWSEASSRLEALGPRNVLGRGFAILRREDGNLVRSFDEVKSGERLEALLANGRLILEVKDVDEKW